VIIMILFVGHFLMDVSDEVICETYLLNSFYLSLFIIYFVCVCVWCVSWLCF
jgi:hypothetical protein